jgi:hypothetical protein
VNFISLPQEVRGIFVIKAAVEMPEKFELNKFHTSKKDPFY